MRKLLSNLLIITGLTGAAISGIKSYNTSKENILLESQKKYEDFDPVIVYSAISSLSLITACAGIAYKPLR
jgi:hypothetical protein